MRQAAGASVSAGAGQATHRTTTACRPAASTARPSAIPAPGRHPPTSARRTATATRAACRRARRRSRDFSPTPTCAASSSAMAALSASMTWSPSRLSVKTSKHTAVIHWLSGHVHHGTGRQTRPRKQQAGGRRATAARMRGVPPASSEPGGECSLYPCANGIDTRWRWQPAGVPQGKPRPHPFTSAPREPSSRRPQPQPPFPRPRRPPAACTLPLTAP